MIPTALEKDAFPALASALTFESKSKGSSQFCNQDLDKNLRYNEKYKNYCTRENCHLG